MGAAGLLATGGGEGSGVRPCVLERVDVVARVVDTGCETQVTQRYRNAESYAVEALYRFPVPHGAAVCGLSVRLPCGTVVRPSNWWWELPCRTAPEQ